MRTLVIISHTGHYKQPNGQIVGLGSTVTEINHLLEVFDVIYHVGMLHNVAAPANALPYVSEKIIFISLPAIGGRKLQDKLSIVWHIPKVLNVVNKALKRADNFQFRAPTGIGVFVIPYLLFFTNKKGWFKYAGNWKQKNAPLAYRFQKYLLKKQNRIVTINGHWKDQPKQCLSFENPCLSNDEYLDGQQCIKNKYSNFERLNFCFVGRLEDEKGVGLLIEAFKRLTLEEKRKIGRIDIVGHGTAMKRYQTLAVNSDLNFKFHGLLPRIEVQAIYKMAHAIVLPSASEGFPKVIAEAMNYGCMPIVSNVSAIGQYIVDGQNGFLLKSINLEGVGDRIRHLLMLNISDFEKLISGNEKTLKQYTYSYYNQRILNEIFDNSLF